MSASLYSMNAKSGWYTIFAASILASVIISVIGFFPTFVFAKTASNSCKQDKPSDAVLLTPVSNDGAASAEAAFGVQPSFSISDSQVVGEWNIITTRYYQEVVSKKRTTYRCIGERQERDARFTMPSQKQVYWFDSQNRKVATLVVFYTSTDETRPEVAASLLLDGASVQLGTMNAGAIGDLASWKEADVLRLSDAVNEAAKRAPGIVQFVLTRFTNFSDLELIDFSTGYSFGVDNTAVDSHIVLSPDEEAVVLQKLKLPVNKGKCCDVIAEARARTLYYYSDFYFDPALGWDGGHLANWLTKEWVGTVFATDKGKLLGSSAVVAQTVNGVPGSTTYWFNKQGKVTLQE
ncbi:MAG: hypothetical protein WC817_03750 [Patescibacteria group bacterium]|jgi:hypothetical protein